MGIRCRLAWLMIWFLKINLIWESLSVKLNNKYKSKIILENFRIFGDYFCARRRTFLSMTDIARRGVNINTISMWIIFCKYCSHCIISPYPSIVSYKNQKHFNQFIMSLLFCVILFYRIFLPLYLPLSEFVNTGGTI